MTGKNVICEKKSKLLNENKHSGWKYELNNFALNAQPYGTTLKTINLLSYFRVFLTFIVNDYIKQ